MLASRMLLILSKFLAGEAVSKSSILYRAKSIIAHVGISIIEGHYVEYMRKG